MYESFFGLSARPFPAAPLVQHYFPTAAIEQSRQTLIRIVDRAEGPGLIIGQPGLGKTLLLRMLDHHFQNVFHCIHLASAAIDSRKDLLQNVLFELDLPYRNMEEGELRLSLLDFLRPSESCPHGVLLLVDEAHTLPLQLLDEIRMITNLVRDGQPRVRLVLAGDAQLDDVFADPRLDSFNQRIAARCYLEPLNQEQTIEYVQAQIASIGGEPAEIFTPDALVAVYRASGGIPRLINQVCDHSLVMASLGGYQQLDVAGIEEAWADLQQLPGPWNEPAAQANESAESIVEFGSLDEDDAASTSSFAAESFDTPTETEVPATLASAEPETVPDPADETPVADDWSNSEQLVAAATAAPLTAPTAEPTDARADAHVETHVEARAAEHVEPESSTSVESAIETAEIGPEFVDPFGHGFDEEEVVVDRYASLDGGVFAGCPCVSSEEGRALAAIIEQQTGPRLSLVDVDAAANAETRDALETPVEVPLDQLDQPQLDQLDQPQADQPQADQPQADQPQADQPQLDQPQLDQPDQPQLGQLDQPQVDSALDAAAGKLAEASDELGADADLTIQSLANNVFDTASLSNWLFESTTETVVASASANEANHRSQVANERPSCPDLTSPAEPTHPEPTQLEPIQSESIQSESIQSESIQSEPADREPSIDAPRVEIPVVEDEPEPSFLQVHGGPNRNDDRDMIVIDEDENAGVFLTQSGDDLARRVEYQQLFSQLREG